MTALRSFFKSRTRWRRLAREKQFAEHLLEQFDLVTHGGLGHAQFPSRAGEAAETADRLEDAQRIERKLFRQLHG